ncbi:DUF4190 domain-containing protein [Ruminococcus sp. Marseille-P6503]|uniref:DUF4190 domain-containing protein n=1 Tax=Ruminococcus sp. Marseille-P6503 TaxID=2364796 RepID=UPI000F52ED28|nr:DUF4190 domain-containing protein [Ruminococcus sp. Marseille-P6503]
MEEKNSVGLSVASMVLGICSIVFSCFAFISIPCAIIGVILGGASLATKKGGKGMAVAGLVTSIISLVPTIIVIVTGSSILNSLF